MKLKAALNNFILACQRAHRYTARFGWGLLVGRKVFKQRVEICRSCPQYSRAQCLECYCFIPIKAKLKTESCPRGKWFGSS